MLPSRVPDGGMLQREATSGCTGVRHVVRTVPQAYGGRSPGEVSESLIRRIGLSQAQGSWSRIRT